MKNIDDYILVLKIGVPFAFVDSAGTIQATSTIDISVPGVGLSMRPKAKADLMKLCKAQATKAAKAFGLTAKLMTMDAYADWLDEQASPDKE